MDTTAKQLCIDVGDAIHEGVNSIRVCKTDVVELLLELLNVFLSCWQIALAKALDCQDTRPVRIVNNHKIKGVSLQDSQEKREDRSVNLRLT